MGYRYNCESNHFMKTNEIACGLPQLMWHITDECRFNCKFCFAKQNHGNLDIQNLEMYINKMKEISIQKIDISGGEPLQYYFLKDVCEKLYYHHIYMTITTRGIGRDENIKWIINNQNKFCRIIVSLDVPNSFLLKQVAGDSQYFDRTIRFIKTLGNKGYNNTRINTVITKYLLDDEILEEMAHLVMSLKCSEWCLIEPHPANRKKTFDEVAVEGKIFEMIIEKIRKIMKKHRKCKILVRYAMNYSDYWVLDPEGILSKHTDGKDDIMKMDFLKAKTEVMLQRIEKYDLWLPEEKDDL